VISLACQGVAKYLPAFPYLRRGYGLSGCSIIAAAGERFRRQLIASGVQEDRIRVTGQPRLDEAVTSDLQTHGGRKHKHLLFCSQPIPAPRGTDRQLLRDLIETCDALSDVRLLVKLHPRERDEGYWLNALAPGSGGCLEAVTKGRRLEDCFSWADAMITVASTTCIEAMQRGLPVALVNYLQTPWYLPYDESGAALSIPRRDQLSQAVLQLFDPVIKESLAANAEALLLDELFQQDGKSASRIVDFIERHMGQV
jgi:hypothetical protein